MDVRFISTYTSQLTKKFLNFTANLIAICMWLLDRDGNKLFEMKLLDFRISYISFISISYVCNIGDLRVLILTETASQKNLALMQCICHY